MKFEGLPSDQSPKVLATGETSVRLAFVSLSARDPDGKDAEYLEWHTLDHRPEQYRLAELRGSMRLVSTPECRAVRAASVDRYDAVDHVMTYLFTGEEGLPGFIDLGGALNDTGRMRRLPSVGFMTAALAGKVAAERIAAGSDVVPWRPASGAYLMIEKGEASPAGLIDVAGVAGVWWYSGLGATETFGSDSRGLQITYCYLDADPVATGKTLGEAMKHRWATGEVEGLLAAPFFCVVPFEWDRYLP